MQCGALGDLVWKKWISEESPLSLGGHELPLELPPHWNFAIDGNVIPVTSMNAIVDISGLFGGRIGQATGNFYSLVKASDSTVDRNLFKVEIDVSKSDYALTWVHSNDELQKLLRRTETFLMHHRIKIPRILAPGLSWLHSAPFQKLITNLLKSFKLR